MKRSLPSFIAAVVLCSPSFLAAGEDGSFRFADDADQGVVDVLVGEQPALRYMYAFDASTPDRRHETYKVYHHVFGPGTKQIITKGPGGRYTHHRGLYVGWNRTSVVSENKTYDFWHCTNGVHQRHVKFLERKADGDSATTTALIHWNDAEGRPVITETRTVAVTTTSAEGEPGYGWQIDWKTTLKTNRGEIRLTGDRQHAGFQFRAHNHVAETNGARYIRPQGHPQQPAAFQVNDRKEPDKHVDLGWLAMSYKLDGRTYTIEYFEDHSLPSPSRYSERPYGRFGAFFEATLKEDQPLTMRYRVRVTTGEPPNRAAIQKRYEAFATELKARRRP